MSAKVGKDTKEGTCWYMLSFAIDIIGAADACGGVGLVGEGCRAMRSSVGER